jgi:hypothetical protein
METAVDTKLSNDGICAELVAGEPNRSLSSDRSSDTYARMFGLSLAALLAACLVLNAASLSTRTLPSGTTHSEQCMADQGAEEALLALLEKRMPFTAEGRDHPLE